MLANLSDYVTVAKDIVLIIAAVIGSYVALRGLNTWNRQLKGGVEYELTRRLLKLTYRLREAIKGVRNPIMWGGETPTPDTEEAKDMSPDRRRFYDISNAYQKRWDKVTEVQADLQTELLEAEALWGQDIHSCFEPLLRLQQELFVAVHFYITACNPSESEDVRDAMSKAMRKKRDILYDMSGEKDDEFTNDVNQAIKSIEALLKPHLRK